jgi:hypothetical protein
LLPKAAIAHLPTLIALNVGDGMAVIRSLEHETGVLFDEAGVYNKLIELLAVEKRAKQLVDDYIDYQTWKQCGMGLCRETQEFLQCFAWLADLLHFQLRHERLYQQGHLPYAVDHMRASSLVLRRTDSIYDLIQRELASPST